MESVRIRRVRAAEWPALRSLRLAALADAPGAFEARLEVESAFEETVWRDRAERGSSSPGVATFVAEAERDRAAPTGGAEWVGLAGGLLSDDGADADLFSMWVAPAARRSGIALQLVEAVAAWAAGAGARSLSLWVADDNTAAFELYRRAAFNPTGLEGPFPNHPGTTEVRLSRPLAAQRAAVTEGDSPSAS
jgi:GNAT superfamily N-acetyltransferase